VALAQVIATASPAASSDGGPGGGAGTTSSPAGSDPMAVAGTLVAMFASVSAHRYGFEFWGIRTRNLIDTQARMLHWAVTGRLAPPPVATPSRESTRPRTGPVLGGATARRRGSAMPPSPAGGLPPPLS
jgi:hypothetical protein